MTCILHCPSSSLSMMFNAFMLPCNNFHIPPCFIQRFTHWHLSTSFWCKRRHYPCPTYLAFCIRCVMCGVLCLTSSKGLCIVVGRHDINIPLNGESVYFTKIGAFLSVLFCLRAEEYSFWYQSAISRLEDACKKDALINYDLYYSTTKGEAAASTRRRYLSSDIFFKLLFSV